MQHLESSAGIDFEGVAQVTCGAPGRLGDTVQVAVFALYEGSFGSRALAVVRGKVEPHGYVAIGRDLVDGPKGRSDAAEHGDVEVSIVGLDEGVGIVTVDQKGASGGWGKIMERRKDARCGDAKEEAAADLELMNKAQELDPSSSVTLADKGVMLFNAGRTREGIDLLMEVERSDPGFRSPHYYMMLIRLYLRDYPAYLTEGQKAAEISHDAVLRTPLPRLRKAMRAMEHAVCWITYTQARRSTMRLENYPGPRSRKHASCWARSTTASGRVVRAARSLSSHLPGAPGLTDVERRASVQSPGKKDQFPGR